MYSNNNNIVCSVAQRINVSALSSQLTKVCRKSVSTCRDYITGSVDYVRKCSVSLGYIQESVTSLASVQSNITQALNVIKV